MLLAVAARWGTRLAVWYLEGFKSMDTLPVFLDVKGKNVLVVGGGTAAARKAELASRAGAAVTIVAPDLTDDLARLVQDRGLVHQTAMATQADVAGCILAFCASEDGAINAQVRALAAACGVPVNVVDRPDLCQFTMPAILDRDGIVVAFSSGGRAPLLARMLKARLETQVPVAYGRLARFAGSWRVRVAERLGSFDLRRRLWESVFEGPVAELIFAGREAEAERAMAARLAEAAADGGAAAGEVYLVGAGPGDPDLLTFRALRLMQKAEVVLYDRTIGDDILNLVRRDAERIFIGEGPGSHTLPHEDVGGRLLSLAREGKRVLHLMNGDPYAADRAAAEIEHLARAGIPHQVVPGVTAAGRKT